MFNIKHKLYYYSMITYSIEEIKDYILKNNIKENKVLKEKFNILNDKNNIKKVKKVKKGIHYHNDIIINIMNKITDSTFENMKEEMIQHLKNIEWNETTIPLIETIFSISSKNCFYSNLFALLYKDIIEFHPLFNDIMINNTKTIFNFIDDLMFDEDNYDLWCDEQKRIIDEQSLCIFYMNLYKIDLLNEEYIHSIIQNLIKKMKYTKKNENINYEIVNILFKMYEIDNTLNHSSIKFLNELKKQDGINNKILFKIMDIFDMFTM